MRRTLSLIAAVILGAAPAVAPMFVIPRSADTPQIVTHRTDMHTVQSRAQSAASIERLCADYLGQRLTMEVIGDSILYGTDPQWSSLLRRGMQPHNSGIWNGAGPGTVAADYLPYGGWYNHTQFIRDVKPTVVVLGWRTNEQYLYEQGLARGATPDQLRQHVVQLVKHFRLATPDTAVIIVNAPRPLRGWNYAGLQTYVDALWDAKLEIGALWLDLTPDFPRDDAENTTGQIMPDGLHPSAAGQSTIAAAVRGRIHGTCTR